MESAARRRCVFVMLLLIQAACSSTERLAASREPLQLDGIPVSYGHRREEAIMAISDDEWQALAELFSPPPASALEERLAVRKAVAMLEQVAGRQTSTFRDWRMDDLNPAGAGCLDCIDEAVNTTTYLRLLEERGLLHHHEVMEKAFRGPLQLDTHYAGQLREKSTGELYVVDSWFLANGWPPYVQKTGDWLAHKDWPQEENPETWNEEALDRNVAYWPKTE